jgi:hypothetical protein
MAGQRRGNLERIRCLACIVPYNSVARTDMRIHLQVKRGAWIHNYVVARCASMSSVALSNLPAAINSDGHKMCIHFTIAGFVIFVQST